jgi:hypothetical protein
LGVTGAEGAGLERLGGEGVGCYGADAFVDGVAGGFGVGGNLRAEVLEEWLREEDG